MKQGFVRVQVMGVLPSGQKQVAILADGADGIRFYTDDKSIVQVPVHLLQAQKERRLLVLPCPMGAKIYMIVRKYSRLQRRDLFFIKVSQLKESNFFRVLREFGKTIFDEREEAQAMMAKLETVEIALRSGTGRCHNCDYGRDADRRCMCDQSQWAGKVTPQDNYCRHWWPREEEI